jgi:hypothetical protein
MSIISLPHAQSPPETDSAADHWYAIADIPKQPQWTCLNRRLLYREIAEGRLRAARVGLGRRRLFVRGAWIIEWLEQSSTPQEIRRR